MTAATRTTNGAVDADLPPATLPGASASYHVDAENPWPGLWPFTEGSRDFFNGRTAETAELARLVRRETLTVLHGQSGLGKSSLLMAGLFPLLRAGDYLPVYVRLDHAEGQPPLSEQIFGALLAACARVRVEAPPRADAPAGAGLWEYLHGREARFWDEKSRVVTPVLVIDQFEELFTLGRITAEREARSQAFEAELAALVDNRPPAALGAYLNEQPDRVADYDLEAARYKIVLGMREDYVASLDRLKRQMRLNLYNFFRLLPMNRGQALEAILKTGGPLIDDAAADVVVQFLARRAGAADAAEHGDSGAGEVDPALLSVVCRELNDRRRQLGRPRITPDLLAGLSPRTILSGFYERSFAGLDPRVRTFVEEELLTATGYRSSAATDDARQAPGVSTAALEALVQRRLLRVDTHAHPERVELTHDVLTDVVKESRDRRRAADAQAEERLALEAREAEAQARLGAERARAAAARQRARWYSALAAVFVAVAAWAMVEGARARTAAADATRATAAATGALRTATLERTRADSLRLIAERGEADTRRLNAAMGERDQELQRTVDALQAAQARTRVEQLRALVGAEVADNYLRISNRLIARRLAQEAGVDSTVEREIARVARLACVDSAAAAHPGTTHP